jgi:hypothetical protein
MAKPRSRSTPAIQSSRRLNGRGWALTLFGVVLLGERLGASALAGMALIFAGLACVDGRVLARLRPARAA